MLRNHFHCDICNRTYHMASVSKHLRSNKQIINLNNAQSLSYMSIEESESILIRPELWLFMILRWIMHHREM